MTRLFLLWPSQTLSKTIDEAVPGVHQIQPGLPEPVLLRHRETVRHGCKGSVCRKSLESQGRPAGMNLLRLIRGAVLAAQAQPLPDLKALDLESDLQVLEQGDEPVDRRCDALPEPTSFHERTVENRPDRTLIRPANAPSCQCVPPTPTRATFIYRRWRAFASSRACRKINRPVALMVSAGIGQANGPAKLSNSGPRQISNQQASDSNGSKDTSPPGRSRHRSSYPCSRSQPAICRSSSARACVHAFTKTSLSTEKQRAVRFSAVEHQ